MSAAEQLLAVFEGSQKGHGATNVGRIGRNGKADAKSFVIRETLTAEKLKGHIDGEQGIGSIPIRSGDVCKFGALDIDIYDLEQKDTGFKTAPSPLQIEVGRCTFIFIFETLGTCGTGP